MPWAGEESRATAYRAQVARRIRAEAARARLLAGDTAAATALRDRWSWLLAAPVEAPEIPDAEQPLS